MKEQLMELLKNAAKKDESVDRNLKKKNKSIDECCEYITNEVMEKYTKSNGRKNGGMFVSDDEVLSMAIHYYDEDSIKVKKTTNASAKVSASVAAKPKSTKATVATTPIASATKATAKVVATDKPTAKRGRPKKSTI